MKRPTTFEEFHGQRDAISQLRVAIKSAKIRKAPLGHCLLYGSAGLGKTSLAQYVIPHELGVPCRALNCAAVEKPQDLLPTLTTMKGGHILFLDEVHMLPVALREHLLTVMEDSAVTVNVGTEEKKNLVTVTLPRYTVVAATTRLGALPETLQDRFKLRLQLELYGDDDMADVLRWLAKNVGMTVSGVSELVPVCHGTARIAVNLIDACVDTLVAAEEGGQDIDTAVVAATLRRLGYVGSLTRQEAKLIRALYTAPKNCLGLSALAAVLDDEPETVESVFEPWLMQSRLITRSAFGRTLTESGREWYETHRKDL